MVVSGWTCETRLIDICQEACAKKFMITDKYQTTHRPRRPATCPSDANKLYSREFATQFLAFMGCLSSHLSRICPAEHPVRTVDGSSRT